MKNKIKKTIPDQSDSTMAVQVRGNDTLYQRGYIRVYDNKQMQDRIPEF